VVVAAAGNAGQPDSPVDVGAPANDPFIITVGAVDENGTADPTDDFRAPWSSYGTTVDGFTKPDISAPGRWMIAPVPDGSLLETTEPDRVVAPGYMWMSGTSFAAPVVAGAADLLLALHPDWTPDDIKGALMASATPLASPGTGIGEVNIADAAAVTGAPSPNAGLDAYAWHAAVQTDPDWNDASLEANWTASNWTAANWTSANWTAANWTEANWTDSNWTDANWTAANWTEISSTEANSTEATWAP